MDTVRVLRIVEYVGEREWVEETIRRSIPAELILPKGRIRTATLGTFPEILETPYAPRSQSSGPAPGRPAADQFVAADSGPGPARGR